MSDQSFVERVWYSSDAVAVASRTLLAPIELAFSGIFCAREMLYDAGSLPSHDTALPVVIFCNHKVGGTGKTPVAAWIAHGLVARGAHPAIVLRGYGDDEPLVHQRLNADVPVFTGADRGAVIARAAAAGADVAVLDDGFQHRQVHRDADLVLVSADQWTGDVRLLPAGPWREPLDAVRRATLIIVTRKAASDQTVEQVHQRLSRAAPAVPRVGMRLELGSLLRADGSGVTRPVGDLSGARVHAVVSVGDPRGFVRQLEQQGGRVTASIFPDHHPFAEDDMAPIVAAAGASEWVVCTLKDAVKLGPLWPRLGPALWYVSQHVTVERGVGGIERLLDDLVRARPLTSATQASQTAG